MILRASHVLSDATHLYRDGGLQIEGGRVVRVLSGPRAVQRAARASERAPVDLGDGLLAPGFVNAHAHLELGALLGTLPARSGFPAWIGAILRARRELSARDYAAGVASGARRLLAGGTTTAGDIASTEAGALASRGRMRCVVLRELLDAWKLERTAPALERVRRRLPPRVLRSEGLSPHAPYTTSSALLDGVRRLCRARPRPVSVHWSETRAEVDWLRDGGGDFASVLGPSPRRSGLDLLEEAGLLRASTSLVHGNHPRRGEPDRLARAGIVLVHCPGTHGFFGRAAFPWERYRRAGVTLALGTDSLASNDELDMAREMRLARAANPSLSPADVFAMATSAGARALGLSGTVGALRRGAAADCVLHTLPVGGAAEPLEVLTSGEASVARVWVGGRRAHP